MNEDWNKVGSDLEHRVRDVETDLASFKGMTDERVKTLFASLGALTVTLDKVASETNRLNINIETDRIHAHELGKRLCSAPNLCLDLKPIVERHEKILNEQKGGWKALSVIGGLCLVAGSFLGWLGSHLINAFSKN